MYTENTATYVCTYTMSQFILKATDMQKDHSRVHVVYNLSHFVSCPLVCHWGMPRQETGPAIPSPETSAESHNTYAPATQSNRGNIISAVKRFNTNKTAIVKTTYQDECAE